MKKLIAILLLALVTNTANAFDFDIPMGDESIEIEWTNTVKYGAQYRLQNPSKEGTTPKQPSQMLIVTDQDEYFRQGAQASRILNGNDGNLNSKGLVSNRLSLLSELNIGYKNFGLFARMRGWYDAAYQGKPEAWSPLLGFNGRTLNRYPAETRDYLGAHHELLDLYASARFDIFGRPASIRVGRQVIGWGESLAFSNSIMSAINPVDAVAGTAAGIDLKEITLPTEAIYFQMALTEGLTLQTYMQWKHRPINMVPAGSFWSQQDFLGRGGQQFIIGGVGALQRNDIDANDMGQWGVAIKWLIDGGTEFGFYGLNYHDKAASFASNVQNGTYDVDYKENIALYGFSFSTAIGTANLSGELSYRRNAPIILDSSCVPGVPGQSPYTPCFDHAPGETTTASVYQAQVSFVHILGNVVIADQLTTTGELMGWAYSDVDKADLSDAETVSNTNTPQGLGSLLRAELAYYSVAPSMNILIPMTWQYGISGTNLRSNSQEGVSIFSLGVTFDFDFDFKTGIVYTQYDGESDDQFDKNYYMLNDRDNVSFNMSYSF